MLKSMILFPEIFSNRSDKFNRLAVWLVNSEGIVCPNIRDVFTAGGQGMIQWNKKKYTGIPKIIVRLSNSISELKALLIETDVNILEKYWDVTVKNKIDTWIELIKNNTKTLNSINLGKYLKDKIANSHS